MTDISLTSQRRIPSIIFIGLIQTDTLTQKTQERSAGLMRFPLLPTLPQRLSVSQSNL